MPVEDGLQNFDNTSTYEMLFDFKLHFYMWFCFILQLEEKPKMLTEIHVPGRPICMTVSSN